MKIRPNAYGVEVTIDTTPARPRVSWVLDGESYAANASGRWVTDGHRPGFPYDVIRDGRGTVIMLRPNLVEAVKAHALAHYKDGGWDVLVECWSDEQIDDVLTNALDDIETHEQAIAHFRDGVVGVWADRQADARNSAF